MDEKLQFVARRQSFEGIRDLSQDWLQDLRSLPGMRNPTADRSQSTALSVCTMRIFICDGAVSDTMHIK
jgi:hypothetical protein